MEPTLEQITQLFSTAADSDALSGREDDFLALLEPSPDDALSDDELALAAGGVASFPIRPNVEKADYIVLPPSYH